MVKLDVHVFSEATRVVILQGFGISKGLEEIRTEVTTDHVITKYHHL